MAYNEIRTINNIQLEDIKARQFIKDLDNKKANKSDIVNGLNFKGTTTYNALPISDNDVGDFYYVTDGDGTNGEGNYAWNGTAWYFSGKTTDFGDISTKANVAVNSAAFEEGKLKVTKNDGASTETEVIDSSLTKSGKAADAKITGDKISELKEDKVDKPSAADDGKIPRAKGGEVEWVEVGRPTDEQTNSAVSNWLNEHPEATTTVQDGSITEAKLTNELKLLVVNSYINAKYTGLSEKNDGERNKIAIKKAIEWAISNKASVFIPSGVYTVDGGISLTGLRSLTIFGYGSADSVNNSTTIKNETYTSLFVIDGCYSCSICNLKIQSANAPAIEMRNKRSHKNTFKNININNVQTNGIKITAPTGYTFFENVFISLNNKSAVAIDIDGTGVYESAVKPNYIYFKQCAIDSINTGSTPACDGIHLKNCYYIFFDSCDFAHLQNAVCLLEKSSYVNFTASVFFDCGNAFNRMKKSVTYDYGSVSNCIFKCLNYAFFIQSDSEYDQLYRYWAVSSTYIKTGEGVFKNSNNNIFEMSSCMFEPANPDLNGKTSRRNCLTLNRYYVSFDPSETKEYSVSIANECVKSFGALSTNSKILVNSVSVSGRKATISLTNTLDIAQATYITLI